MKNLLLFLFSFILIQSEMIAQNNQGAITYEETINVHKNLPAHMADMKDRIPEFRTSKFLLHFNEKETFYDRVRESDQEDKEYSGRRNGGRRGGGRWMRGMGRNGSGKTYTDLTTDETLSEADVFGKEFLVKGQREIISWKMTGEQKQVGDYLCMQATYQDSIRNIEAWFTPMIPVAAGPGNYGSLPGMILHMDINQGERTITASNIELAQLEANSITKPSKGEEVSKAEFTKIMTEKRKEMEAEWGDRRKRMGKGGRRGGRGN